MAVEERRLGDWLFSWPHKDAHVVCGPGLTSRLGLSSWPARYPHTREMKHVKIMKRISCACFYLFINSQKPWTLTM